MAAGRGTETAAENAGNFLNIVFFLRARFKRSPTRHGDHFFQSSRQAGDYFFEPLIGKEVKKPQKCIIIYKPENIENQT